MAIDNDTHAAAIKTLQAIASGMMGGVPHSAETAQGMAREFLKSRDMEWVDLSGSEPEPPAALEPEPPAKPKPKGKRR